MPKGRRSGLETHEQREAILAAIARKIPTRTIAKTYGVSHWAIYRWINSNRPKQDRDERRALRKLKAATKTGERADRIIETVGGDDLTEAFAALQTQQQRLVEAQNFAIKIGDVQKIATISDSIARNVRHAAALGEILRLRLQGTPSAHFSATQEYRQLRLDLMSAVRLSPAVAERTAAVLDHFEAKVAPIAVDELEAQY